MTQPINRNRRTSMKLLALSLTSAGLLAACGGSDDDDFDDRADIADPKLRFVHAVPGAPAVTLLRNGNAESNASNVAYKYGSQYYDIGTVDTQLSLRLASNINTVLAAQAFPARRGNRYTAVALPSTTASSGVELLVIDDPYNKSVTSDNARLRFVNASANAPSVDVYVTAPAVDLATVLPTAATLGYKQVAPGTTADSREFEGGNYQIRVTPAGSKTAFYSSGTIAVPRNGDWLILTLPDDATPLLPNRIRLLVVRADGTADATDELPTVP